MTDAADAAFDSAVLAADRVLARVPADTDRLAIAADVAAAVLESIMPTIINEINVRVDEVRREHADQLATSLERLDVAAGHSAMLHRRLKIFFEEFDPAATAAQLIGHLTQRDWNLSPSDHELIAWVVATTVRRVAASIGMALTADSSQIPTEP